MVKGMSNLSLSTIVLYEELIIYLLDNKKLKLTNKVMNKITKINKKIRESNDSRDNYDAFINFFERVIRNRFSNELLHNFDDNIEDLKVFCIPFQLGDFLKSIIKYAGKYNPIKNIMFISKDKESIYSIYHELFHMASTNRMITDYVQTGFMAAKDNMRTGDGLNEGYTDLLAHRYFEMAGFKIAYILECQYAKMLEKIVGREKMENYYISSDPAGLIKELEKYDSHDNIIDFIKLLDVINNPKDSSDVRIGKINEVTKTLILWYTRKLFLEGENLQDPTIRDMISSFALEIPAKIVDMHDNSVTNIDIDGITSQVIEETVKQNSGYYRR